MKVLAIVAHADDMETHCGGVMAKYRSQGHDCAVIVTTNGNKGSFSHGPAEIMAIRREEQCRACRVLDMEPPVFLDFEDNMMQPTLDTQLRLTAAIRAAAPDVIFTHFPQDGSNDHKVTANVVINTLISLRFGNMPIDVPPMAKSPSVFFFDSDGGIGFLPEIYIDITEEMPQKVAAFSCHKSQIACDERYMQDVELLSRFRGYQAGVGYAEAFRAYSSFGFVPDFKRLP